MPQPTWTWCPLPGAARKTKLNVDQANFGDGYTERTTRGLNPARPSWDVSFPFVGFDELDAMDRFLVANAALGFWWQPPDAAEAFLVTADDWAAAISDRTRADGIIGTLQSTFTRQFNPQP